MFVFLTVNTLKHTIVDSLLFEVVIIIMIIIITIITMIIMIIIITIIIIIIIRKRKMIKWPLKPLEQLSVNFFSIVVSFVSVRRGIKRWTSIMLYKLFKVASPLVLLPARRAGWSGWKGKGRDGKGKEGRAG